MIYQGAAGRIHSDVEVDSAEFTPDSCSWIASMTKLVTSVAVMRIVETGLVGLDHDVRHVVPQLAKVQVLRGFVGNDVPYLLENKTPITLRYSSLHFIYCPFPAQRRFVNPRHRLLIIVRADVHFRRQLLTHTSGFGYGSGDPDLIRWAKHTGRRESELKGDVEIWNTPLKFEPGQGWYYGTGCDWAGQVVEKLTKQTLGAFMQEHVFLPLGMNDTTFRPDALPHIQGRLVPTAHRDAKTGELASGERPSVREGAVDSGGAGLYSTAADYAKLLHSLLASLAGQDDALLERETVEDMLRPQLTSIQSCELKFLTDLFHDGMASDFEPGMPLDHGISGVVNLEDAPGKRRKGSMMWGGMANGHWVSASTCHLARGPASCLPERSTFLGEVLLKLDAQFLDRQAGIGATLITNILPHPDAVATKVWNELECAVYSDLITG